MSLDTQPLASTARDTHPACTSGLNLMTALMIRSPSFSSMYRYVLAVVSSARRPSLIGVILML